MADGDVDWRTAVSIGGRPRQRLEATRRPSGGGRGLAAIDLGFEGVRGAGLGRMHGVRGRGGHGGRRTHGSPDRRVKMETGKLTDRGGGGGRTGERKKVLMSFFLHFILFICLS
jgi:hypothetical protein